MSYAQRIVDAYPVDLELAQAIVDAAAAVDADPGLLADLINYETAETFSPTVQNPGSTAVGLIQFISKTAKGLGTSTSALLDMTALEQMVYVKTYLEGVMHTYGPLDVEWKLYMAVFYPAAISYDTGYAFDASVTAVNASETVQDYVDAVQRRSKLGALLSSSSSSGAPFLLLLLILGVAATQ